MACSLQRWWLNGARRTLSLAGGSEWARGGSGLVRCGGGRLIGQRTDFNPVADIDVVEDKESEDEDTVPVMANSPRAENVAAPDSDDDSLQGYDSPTSSRSASPTQSELEEIEKDPTLRATQSKPVTRPVYLMQLIGLLRAGGGDDVGAADKMQMGLTHAEGLVRRERGVGQGVGRIILGSMVLAQYLGTLAVLVHAARHAPAFLSVVVLGAVEIALALGQRGAMTQERGNSGPNEKGSAITLRRLP